MAKRKREKGAVTPVELTQEHEAFRKSFLSLLGVHCGTFDGAALLCVAAQAVGQLVALQDPAKISKAHALSLVRANVEAGLKAVEATRVTDKEN